MDRAGPGFLQDEHVAAGLVASHVLEPEPLAPHQKKRRDIPEIQPVRVSGILQPVETTDEDLVVDDGPTGLVVGRNTSAPVGNCLRGRAGPGVGRVVGADELALPFGQDGMERFARTQFTTGRRTDPRWTLDFVVRHLDAPSVLWPGSEFTVQVGRG